MKQYVREIVIAGTPLCVYLQTNFLITIDGLDIYLPLRLYRVTSILAMRRVKGDGWVSKSDLDPGGLAGKYLTRTKGAIRFRVRQAVMRGEVKYEHLARWGFRETYEQSDKPVEYRLLVSPDRTKIVIGPDATACGDQAVIREVGAFEKYSRHAVDIRS